jgi:hypothetical protein
MSHGRRRLALCVREVELSVAGWLLGTVKLGGGVGRGVKYEAIYRVLFLVCCCIDGFFIARIHGGWGGGDD